MRIGVLCLLLAVCGCRKSQEKAPPAEVEVEGDKVSVRTDEGTITVERSGTRGRVETKDGGRFETDNKVPEGFPLPIMKGATVIQGIRSSQPGQPESLLVNLQVAESAEVAAAFYEKALADKGLKTTRTEQKSSEGTVIALVSEGDDVRASAIANRRSNEDKTSVMLSWNAKK